MIADALVVGACAPEGHEDFYASLIRDAGLVVAADAGLAVCLGAGRVPDACVGDMDSVTDTLLSSAQASGMQVVRFPAEKDASDLDLAVAHAREAGVRALVVTAAFRGRLDHTLAALGTLLRNADLRSVGLDPGLQVHALDAELRASADIDRSPGSTLSVFAVDRRTVVSISGVRYPLRDASLDVLSSHGLSNVALESPQRVEILAGRALVICDDAQDITPALQNFCG